MKNPNSPAKRLKEHLRLRWSKEDYPGASLRIQPILFVKDVGIFILLPLASVAIFKSCEMASSGPSRSKSAQQNGRDLSRPDGSKSQIIDFRTNRGVSALSGVSKKSPGSLVKLRLLNVVETYSNAPVHALIIDAGLGQSLMGGRLIGDATPDTNFNRINITFRFARDPNRENFAVPISARALSVEGTLGLVASKKEGFVTRSTISSAGSATQSMAGGPADTADFKQVLFKALGAGLLQEFGNDAQVERNRSQVLTLAPGAEFFAELTDFFPGSSK